MRRGRAAKPDPTQAAIDELKTGQGDLSKRLDTQVTDLRKYVTDAVASEGRRLAAQIQPLSSQKSDDREYFDSKLQASAVDVRAAVERVEGLGGRLGPMEGLLEKLEARVEALTKASESDKDSLEGTLRDARASMEAFVASRVGEAEDRCKTASSEQVGQLSAELREAMAVLPARCDQLQADLDDLKQGLEQARAAAAAAQAELRAAVEAQQATMHEELSGRIDEGFASAEARKAGELAIVDETMRVQQQGLQYVTNLAENMFTRSITWRLRGFSHRLERLLQSNGSLRSSEFSLCSLPEMALEIGMTCKEEAGLSPPLPCPGLPLPGSCSIRLWAAPGLRIAFRLTLGEGPQAVAKRFEHTFQPYEVAGVGGSRACFQMPNFCQLNQIWAKEADMVALTFELLEFRGTLSQAPPPAPGTAADTRTGDLDKTVAAAEGFAGASPFAIDSGGNEFTYSRVATSEVLVQERLQQELQAVRNRCVRRIEWRVDGCRRLLDVCRPGDAVDSPVFQAAGLDRLQFHFYPHGNDTGAAPGHGGAVIPPCALLVSGPVRTSVKGQLIVGSQSRSFSHRFQSRGDVGGRGRHCALENQLDCNDSVLIALELTEVEVDVPEQSSTTLCVRAVQQQERAPAAGASSPNPPKAPDFSYGYSDVSPTSLAGTRGLLRMKREDPSKTQELVKCVSLPTLTTRQFHQTHPGPRGGRRVS